MHKPIQDLTSHYPNWIERLLSISCMVTSLAIWILLILFTPAAASNHYTEKQLDALEARVGKIFWISAVEGKLPSFVRSPTSDASAFHPGANESFEITELVGRKARNPYYKVKFESGAEGYIHAQAFHEQFNAGLVADEHHRFDVLDVSDFQVRGPAVLLAQSRDDAVRVARDDVVF